MINNIVLRCMCVSFPVPDANSDCGIMSYTDMMKLTPLTGVEIEAKVQRRDGFNKGLYLRQGKMFSVKNLKL